MRNGSISTTCKSINKLNKLLPNCFLPSHWYLLGIQRLPDRRENSCYNTAIFHVLLKGSGNIFPLHSVERREAPWRCGWWRLVLFTFLGLLILTVITQSWCTQATWPAAHNLCSCHAQALKVPLAFILISHFNTKNIPFSWFIFLPLGRPTQNLLENHSYPRL